MLKVNSVGFSLTMIILCLGVCFSTMAVGQPINPADPTLRLWLKAQDMEGSHSPGDPVSAWIDASSYGTIMGIQDTGEAAGDPENHTPQLVNAYNNGHNFSAVNFRNAYDPVTPDPEAGHLSDRLYQKNNFNSGGSDPLDIGAGTDLSIFVVVKNNATDSQLGPWGTIMAKRGPTGCPYHFGTANGGDSHLYYTYDDTGEYVSDIPGPILQGQWRLVEMNIASEAVTFTEYDGVNAPVSSTPLAILARNATVGDDTPFTIAFHAQGAGADAGNPWGNGAYERFAGQIAEIVIFARDISGSERDDIVTYLSDKYLTLDVQNPINPADPQLRLWLKADAITAARAGVDHLGNPVEYVDVWPDGSSYNNLIAAPDEYEPLINNDIDNHTPQLVTVTTTSGKQVKAVNFRQAYDPVTIPPDPGYHLSDRMYQRFDCNEPDPLDIIGEMTAFVVFNNAAAESLVIGPVQSVFSKRGPQPYGPYQFGHAYSPSQQVGQNIFLSYTGGNDGVKAYNTVFPSGLTPTPPQFALSMFEIVGTTLTFKEYYAGLRFPGVTELPIVLDGRPDPNPGCTPFGIAMHAQGVGGDPVLNPWGNGAGERFSGQISEIILFARPVVGPEREAIENYLLDKYFSAYEAQYCGDTNTQFLAADFNRDCKVDLYDYAALSESFAKCSDPANAACDAFWP